MSTRRQIGTSKPKVSPVGAIGRPQRARLSSTVRIAIDGFAAPARQVRSPNHDSRPAGTDITLVVIHGISLPPGEFGGEGIIDLFTNRLDPAKHPYYAEIASLRVSAHFLIRRNGELLQFVSCNERAWHAGVSMWNGR